MTPPRQPDMGEIGLPGLLVQVGIGLLLLGVLAVDEAARAARRLMRKALP